MPPAPDKRHPAPAVSDGAEFDALEYTADDAFARAHFRFARRRGGGWRIERDGRPHLDLGEGYRVLRTLCCGVCSTDLDRRFLPFPLPQVIGHEIVARDASGQRFVVEINASHRARGLASEAGARECGFCAVGLETHCPERLVLGIHDLPGGFGPRVLVPEHALVPVPDALPDSTAALVEPFAAALRAVTTLDPAAGSCIAVLGPGRLGLLAIAALAAWRRATGRSFDIVALARRAGALERAQALGADRGQIVGPATGPDAGRGGAQPISDPVADVVIDTTGSPEGLAQALMLAQREVHLKSTHGQPAVGLAHLTAAVVDELSIEAVGLPQSRSLEAALADTSPLCRDDRRCVGRVGAAPPSQAPAKDAALWIDAPDARSLLADLEARHAADPRQQLPRVDAVVVGSLAEVDRVIRPDPTREASPLRPTGRVLVRNGAGASSADAEAAPLADGLARGLRISTSRCGDFRAAVELLAHDTLLRRLGDAMVTHRFPATALADAFACARSPEGLKVLVEHGAEDDVPGA